MMKKESISYIIVYNQVRIFFFMNVNLTMLIFNLKKVIENILIDISIYKKRKI
jgi:hypothetical protein